MTIGPIIGAKSPHALRRPRRVSRVGAAIFYFVMTTGIAITVEQSVAQISVEPLGAGTTGQGALALAPLNMDWSGYNVGPSVAVPTLVANVPVPVRAPAAASEGIQLTQPVINPIAPVALDQSIKLSEAELAIGLMPAAQFFQTVQVPRAASAVAPTNSAPVPTAAPLDVNRSISFDNPPPAAHDVAPQPVVSTTQDPGNPVQQVFSDVAQGVRDSAVRSRQVLGERATGGFQGYIGAGMRMHPVYLGSDEYTFSPSLVGHVEFADLLRWSHHEGLEVVPFQDLPVDFALGANWRSGRLDDHEPAGLNKVDGGFEVGAELGVSVSDAEFFVDVEKGITGGNLGWEIEAGIRSQFIRIENSVDVAGQLSATWVDDESMDSMYGVSQAEATASGLDAYDGESGLRDITISLEAMYYFNEHFGVHAGAIGQVLIDNAAKSPIVSDEGNPLQLSSNLGLIYRF